MSRDQISLISVKNWHAPRNIARAPRILVSELNYNSGFHWCCCLRELNVSGHEANCPLGQPNMEALYNLFSHMFDKKMEEVIL